MIVTVSITGDKVLIAKFERVQSAVAAALQKKVTQLTLKLERKIKTEKLNGQVLNRVTGRLARSISHEVQVEQNGVYGRVFSSGDVKYAAIHEFGGQTAPHVIYPKKAAALSFIGSGGNRVFAKKVNHPGSKMPERSFMRSALRDMSTEISIGLKTAVVNAVRGDQV